MGDVHDPRLGFDSQHHRLADGHRIVGRPKVGQEHNRGVSCGPQRLSRLLRHTAAARNQRRHKENREPFPAPSYKKIQSLPFPGLDVRRGLARGFGSTGNPFATRSVAGGCSTRGPQRPR